RPNTPVYITQVHDVVDEQLHANMLKAYRGGAEDVTYLAGYEREDYFPGGYLIVSPSGRITGIMEKPGADKKPSNLVVIVAHIHSNVGRLLDAIHAEYGKNIPTDDHYERAMDTLM